MVVDQEVRLNLNVEPLKSSQLPKWVRPIQIGGRIFLFKWTYYGWKPLSQEEESKIKLMFGV